MPASRPGGELWLFIRPLCSMCAMANKIEVKIEWPDEANTLLEEFPTTSRMLGLKKGFRAAAEIVQKRAKELCPAPGYPGDKPGLKPLRDTIGIAVREYSHALVVLVGPQYPAGAHGHLVEFGHNMVLWGERTDEKVPPKPFMRPAAFETRELQTQAIVGVLQSHLASLP